MVIRETRSAGELTSTLLAVVLTPALTKGYASLAVPLEVDAVAMLVTMVTIVLLKLEFTCATPAAMFLETFFLPPRRVSRAISVASPYFFLPAMGFAGPLRVRALVWVR